MIALGTYFYLGDTKYSGIEDLGWLPLTSLSIYILAFAIGFGPVPWVVLSEVFSNDVKAFAGSATGGTNWFLAFVVTNSFGFLSQELGIGQTFWLFAGFTALGFLFVFLIVPETKGKSIQEIQTMLSGGQTQPE